MYRARLGDCFLLAFRGRRGKPVYMLIDCGIHSQVKGGSKVIKEIAEHIRDSTKGHLDVLVMTHEHGDHISGFYAARDVFQDMQIDEGWFAWTEDPDNAFANRIDRAKRLMLNGLHVAGQALSETDQEAAGNIAGVMNFFTFEDGLGVSSRQTRDLIRGLPEENRYLRPKMPPIRLPGVSDIRIFVLGPPEDEGFLMRARPSKRPGEVYHEDHALALDEVLSAAFLGAAGGELEDGQYRTVEKSKPFASNLRIGANVVTANLDQYAFFRDHYFEDEDNWRRIDNDWRMPAESIALKLDSATNNTSLVLAIELQSTGQVLLFAGDAQVGNWLSWHDGGWTQANGLRRGEEITAEDLLRRTVLYKVGHHGSHNATLREKGLEMMTSEELSALIPVDEKWARTRRPHEWKMPFSPLYEDLVKRTKSRILRSDDGLVRPRRRSASWREFESRVTIDPLFLEVEVPDPD
jgi:hypothetical protein